MLRVGHLSCFDLGTFDASSWAPLMLELSTSHASSWVLVGRLSCLVGAQLEHQRCPTRSIKGAQLEASKVPSSSIKGAQLEASKVPNSRHERRPTNTQLEA